jgi:hypothetical protein
MTAGSRVGLLPRATPGKITDCAVVLARPLFGRTASLRTPPSAAWADGGVRCL